MSAHVASLACMFLALCDHWPRWGSEKLRFLGTVFLKKQLDRLHAEFSLHVKFLLIV